MAGRSVEVQLLGPVSLRRHRARVTPGGPVSQRIIAALAVAGGAPVADDDLIRAAWAPAEQPRRARNALQAHVSRLRNRLGADALPRDERGYRLATARHLVDALVFLDEADAGARLADAGDPSAAALVLRAALARWRGDPLGDVDPGPGLRPWVERLHERQRDVEEGLAACRLVTEGATPESVARLRRLVERQPLRERRWELLVECHLAAGDLEAARRDLATAAAAIREGLGLDLGPGLRALLGRLDAATGRPQVVAPHDPGAPDGRTRPADAAVPSTGAPERLIGRSRELAEVVRCLSGGDVRLVTVTGPAGIGRTALAEAVAVTLGARAEPVVRIGAADEAGVGGSGLLRPVLAGIDPTADPPPEDPLRTRRGLVVIDDATPAVVAELAGLLRRAPRLRALVTATHPLGVAGERVVRLRPLSVPATDDPEDVLASPAVRVLLDRAATLRDRPGLAGRLAAAARDSGGVPLALVISAARLERSPGAPVAAARADVDPGVRTAVLQSLTDLPRPAVDLISGLSQIPGTVSPGFVAHLAGHRQATSGDVDAIVAAQLASRPSAAGGLRVRPDVRLVVTARNGRTDRRAATSWLLEIADGGLVRPLVLARSPAAFTRLAAEADLAVAATSWPETADPVRVRAVLVLAETGVHESHRTRAADTARALLSRDRLSPTDRFDLIHLLLGGAHRAGDVIRARALTTLLVEEGRQVGGEHEALARIDAAVLRLEAGGDDHLASDLDRLVVDCDGQGHARMALRARRFAMHARTVAAGIEAAAMDAWDLVGRLDAMGPTAPDALTSMSEAVSLLAPGVTDVACTGLMRDLDAVLDAWSAAAPLTVSLAIGRTTLLTRLGRHDEAEESARRTATALVAVGWLRGLDFALAHLAGPIARQGRLTDAAEVLGASAGVAPTGVEWAGLPEVRAARDLLDIDGDLLLRSHFDLGRRDPWGVLGGLGVS